MCTLTASEQLRDARSFQRMRRIWAGLFRTKTRSRKDLVWIGEIFGVERAAYELHSEQIRLREHGTHHFLFLFAYPMLAGDGTSVLHAQMQNAIGEVECRLFLPGNCAIVQHQRMQISIAGMEDVGNAQSRGCSHLSNLIEQPGKRSPRNDAVLNDVIWRNTPHGCESGLAALPHHSSLLLRL